MAGFDAGSTVYVRHFQREQVGLVFPCQLVRRRPDGILLWSPPGSPYWHFNMPDGRTLPDTPLAEWAAARHVPVNRATRDPLLVWHPTGADYSIRWLFDARGTFHGWYANLEVPAVAWHEGDMAGLDTVDWDLDVRIAPDRTWRWKDEELFASRLTEPDSYWVDDEPRVRRAGLEVVALVEAGAFPFDGTWQDFTPDPGWPPIPPDLPDGWDRPRHHGATAGPRG
ncbi:MAG TPA: DUF402 domain-containing protein [Micromonosporaceae bacterium]|nr:DUF402 domain-containing protein [Micromonosporaceae bacterium]